MSHHTPYSLAALCATGGIVGFARTGSKPSLVAGLGLGLLYGVSGYLIQKNKDHGHDLAAVTSAVLMGALLPRGLRQRKAMPLVLGSVGVLGLGYHSRKAYEERYGV
ncbi:transmembrane proteins 14C-domain-containing protein [Piptocephalis cylindrospora]|uniref:Transmembrane proteins 14C-domain-containing protein n=1 Tax=Piptocephalis cylindrospora TaxID=1907219 RepID=A0A4P9Y0G2_9FUNG|nr:transmembrane proteins 14C-domain-containing protein [Piptocephalis cylindrospora]|eukprot:RKP11260.1 transmembrane proteins 14C-domain-containing protein [Piptocephalis cylindrospora]